MRNIAAFVAAVAVAMSAACTTVSGTGRKQLNVLSREQEFTLGADAYGEMLGEKGVVRLRSGPEFDRVQRIAGRIEDAA